MIFKRKIPRPFHYTRPDLFVDLCRGPHIQTTREIPLDSFKLTKIAGAYWKGSEKNKMLQARVWHSIRAKIRIERLSL